MDIRRLDDNETRNLEKRVTILENIMHLNMEGDMSQIAFNHCICLGFWYRSQGLATTDTRKKYEETLSTILGYKFNYRRQYKYRTAVWGFVWNRYDLKFVIWLSERGLEIGVEKSLTNEMFFNLCNALEDLIVNK